jgi:DASH complex subunit SPC19
VYTLHVQVFLLVEEERIWKYKSDLTDEIEPQITELIERAEKGLKALNKKEAILQAKVCSFLSQFT